jgi:hypothetical protein
VPAPFIKPDVPLPASVVTACAWAWYGKKQRKKSVRKLTAKRQKYEKRIMEGNYDESKYYSGLYGNDVVETK